MCKNNNGDNQPKISPRLRTKILDSVSLNRVTIVVGPTGSGKSTLIPPLLQEGLRGRVLCSLPRRLAVVAIAKRVATLKGIHKLGGSSDVGFHVGNRNLSTNATQLLFTTTGILLEEFRNNGAETLGKYQCVIVDECHERSPESDLCLALARRFMRNDPRARFRLVLMSATFNAKRYSAYFKDVPGCSVIDTITLETQQSFTAWHAQVETLYLDDIHGCIPEARLAPHMTFLRDMRRDANTDLTFDSGKSLSEGMLGLIRTLIACLDDEETKSAPFLVFVPTYRHLEQLYRTLVTVNGGTVVLNVLHSAIDIEDCMRTLETASRDTRRRHVLLASAIADSSVTVPGVTCVIDLCRSLEVKWDVSKRSYEAKTTWCSKSIADQRKGRTGRTCPGRVFRLVYHGFYIQQLELWDVPQLSMSSCHNEVLSMVCAGDSLGLKEPRKIFQDCLDPPDANVLDDAVQYLVEIGACHQSQDTSLFQTRRSAPTRKLAPTDYGSLVSDLPLTVMDAQVVLEGGRIGLFHETLAMMVVLNHRPAPIVHHFGVNEMNEVLLQQYYPQVAATNKHSTALANLSAYFYWDSHWLRKHERRQYLNSWSNDGSSDAWEWTEENGKDNIEWCRENNLNPTSMRSIKETIESTTKLLYLSKHEPKYLRCSDPNPLSKRVNAMELKLNRYLGCDMLLRLYGSEKMFDLCNALTALAVDRSAEKALPSAQAYFGLTTTNDMRQKTTPQKDLACIHFLMGNCKYGNKCRNAHSRTAPRPLCRFYPNCSKGQACVYSHGERLVNEQMNDNSPDKSQSEPCIPILKELILEDGVLGWYHKHHKETVLVGEGNFEFSNSLINLGLPPFMATTDVLNRLPSGLYPTSRATSMVGIDATALESNHDFIANIQKKWSGKINVVWNFPFITGEDENAAKHEILLRDTFASVKRLFDLLLSARSRLLGLFCVGLQGDQFSRWNVLKSAWAIGWKLQAWDCFRCADFPEYTPRRWNGEAFPSESTRFYVFKYDDR